jgi:surface polysaccharide O-acyltransferase-like enzyme
MRSETVRNVGIILLLAAIVAFVPQGGATATFAGNVISIAITIMFLLFGLRMYQMFRTDIYGLGDRWRAVLYGSIGLVVLAMAARPRLVDTGAGLLVWLVVMAAAAYGLYGCWRQYRSYRY